MCGRVSLCAVVLGLVLQTSARVPASRAGSPNVTARAWQNLPGDFYFPEAELEAVASRPASAILFSGGGSRSFTVTTGYMAALLELGLLDSTRYVSGVSGGSWATVLYAFSNTTNATLLMGNTTFPQNLTADALATLPAGCARRAAVDKDMLTRILEEYLGGSKSEYAWVQAVNDVFMAPFGVPDDVFMAWNASRAAELKGANPVLQNMTIATPRPGAPYFVWSSTVLGPQDDSPFKDNLRTYTLLGTAAVVVALTTAAFLLPAPSPRESALPLHHPTGHPTDRRPTHSRRVPLSGRDDPRLPRGGVHAERDVHQPQGGHRHGDGGRPRGGGGVWRGCTRGGPRHRGAGIALHPPGCQKDIPCHGGRCLQHGPCRCPGHHSGPDHCQRLDAAVSLLVSTARHAPQWIRRRGTLGGIHSVLRRNFSLCGRLR